jgi:hypothetical protein
MTITYLFSFGRLYGGWISSAAVIFLIAMFTFLSEPLHGQITRYVTVTGDDLGGGNACADVTIRHGYKLGAAGEGRLH